MPWSPQLKRRLKLKDLDILMIVATAGTMGRAAQSLNLSQPAISKAIADLERTLGVELLERSRSGRASGISSSSRILQLASYGSARSKASLRLLWHRSSSSFPSSIHG